MKLSNEGIKNKEYWQEKGYGVIEYDRDAMIARTKDKPVWVHFGAGNIFRAFQARVVNNLLNKGVLDRGIIVAEGYDYEIIEKMNKPHDDLSIAVTLKADGSIEKDIVGSVAESLCLDSDRKDQFDRLKEIFTKESLAMATFTITEKGYNIKNAAGNIPDDIKSDMENGPDKPVSYTGKVAALLYNRYADGKKPIAMVSMDNCSHNGDKLKAAMNAFASAWVDNGKADKGFIEYVNDKNYVSFPWTMIDKITPRPDKKVEEILIKDWGTELEPVITAKKTYVAPFVNAEECEYLVIEDSFPNGRPQLEKGGFIFTDRETVDKVEKMKVCTCLNPLHTTLAVFGCLLGYNLISEEMKNPVLKKLVMDIGYKEGLPVVVNPGIIAPEKFIDEVVNKRIPNPFMPDTPQRIATDTSQKLAIRFGETIKAYMQSDTLDVASLEKIPLVFAGWLRYLRGVDDKGNAFEMSPDPRLTELHEIMKNVEFGQKDISCVKKILSDKTIFGVNLYEAGLGEITEKYFMMMNEKPGSVIATLESIVNGR